MVKREKKIFSPPYAIHQPPYPFFPHTLYPVPCTLLLPFAGKPLKGFLGEVGVVGVVLFVHLKYII
jgi:hypothetical protein